MKFRCYREVPILTTLWLVNQNLRSSTHKNLSPTSLNEFAVFPRNPCNLFFTLFAQLMTLLLPFRKLNSPWCNSITFMHITYLEAFVLTFFDLLLINHNHLQSQYPPYILDNILWTLCSTPRNFPLVVFSTVLLLLINLHIISLILEQLNCSSSPWFY